MVPVNSLACSMIILWVLEPTAIDVMVPFWNSSMPGLPPSVASDARAAPPSERAMADAVTRVLRMFMSSLLGFDVWLRELRCLRRRADGGKLRARRARV